MPHGPTDFMPPVEEIGAEIMARADAIAVFNEGSQGITRRFATPEHRAAIDMITGWMRDAGMDAHLDAGGNVVGRYEGERPGLPALMLGSHQYTVREGGFPAAHPLDVTCPPNPRASLVLACEQT